MDLESHGCAKMVPRGCCGGNCILYYMEEIYMEEISLKY